MDQSPDLEAVRALVLVAETGSINAASTRLSVTQQAVSLRVRSLESQLGVPLLVRTPRGSTLTAAGQLVTGWADPLLKAADEFNEAVESLRAGRSKTIHLAASLTIAEHLLPEWIARWRSRLEDASPCVQLTAANSSAVAETVRRGETDLGFIETPDIPSDLGSAVIGYDEIVVVAPPTHRWTATGVITAKELAKTPLVLREPGSGTRLALERALEVACYPISVPPAAVLSTTLGIRSTIAAGTAPGALSSLAVREDIRNRRLSRVRIDGAQIVRPLTAIWLGAHPSRTARDLLAVIGRLARDSIGGEGGKQR